MNIGEDVYIAEGVHIDDEGISIGSESSVWYNSVIRCNKGETVTIGERTNIQDLCMVHTSRGHSVRIGNDVTVGHMSLLHGCTIGDRTLIGMGSVIMNGAVIGSGCVIGAGSLVTEGKEIPDGFMAFGRPAKVVKELTEEQKAGIIASAEEYVEESKEQKRR